MIILEDVLQQANKHNLKHKMWKQMGVHINRCRLICGDYQLPNDGSVAVDTKYDITELENDICIRKKPKKEIKAEIERIFKEDNIQSGFPSKVFDLICNDDAERFPEQQISDYCFEQGISEQSLKKFQELYVKRHGFFHRGLIRAKQYGVKLFVLVENTDGVTDIDSLFRWVNPRRRIMVRSNQIEGFTASGNPRYKKVQKYPNCMMGEQLAKACITMQNKYGVTFLFCKPEESAEKIIEILTHDTSDRGELPFYDE